MKHRKQRNIKIAFLFTVMIAVIGFFYYESETGFQNAGIGTQNEVSFTIPVPDELRFAGGSSSNEVQDIECILQSTVSSIDTTGITLKNIGSSILQGNPLLAVTDSQYKPYAGWVNTMKGWCGASPDQPAVIMDSSRLTMRVLSEKPDGTNVSTVVKTLTTKSQTFNYGDSIKQLGFFSVYASEVEEDLPKTPNDYSSDQKFSIFGNLQVHWSGYSNIRYDIPIKDGDIIAYDYAKIVQDDAKIDSELGDSDGDGIVNKWDNCPDEPEIYNGISDGDGCPDGTGSGGGNDTNNPEEALTKTTCNADNKTWYTYTSIDNTICSTKYLVNNGEFCKEFNMEKKACIDPIEGDATLTQAQCDADTTKQWLNNQCVTDVNQSATGITGKMLWQIDGIYEDGKTFAFQAKDDISPFKFTIPLDVIGGTSVGEDNAIRVFTAQGMILMDSNHKNTSTNNNSDVTYKVYAIVGDGDYPAHVLIKEVNAQDFIPRNGQSGVNGLSLGNVEVRISDVETKVLASLGATWEGTENIKLRVIASGDVGLTINNTDEYIVKLQGQTCTEESDKEFGTGKTDGFCGTLKVGESTETSFVWGSLKFVRGDGGSTGGTFPKTEAECLEAKKKDQAYTWLAENNVCAIVDTVPDVGEGNCIATGGIWTDNVCVKAKGEVTSNGGMCTLDSSFPSDTNNDGALCGFCIDSDTTNNFPCDQPYRDNYCGGVVASPAECGDIPKSCDDLFADKTDGCVVDSGDSCPDGFVALVKGDKLQCNPDFIPDNPDDPDTCPIGGISQLSLLDNVCIVTPPTPTTTTTNTNVCASGVCSTTDNTMLIVGALVAIVGISAVIIKKARK
jgi:hypothetical protein